MPITDTTVCPACGENSRVMDAYPAHFSDFVAHRVFEGKNRSFAFLHCPTCGFAWYNYRFSDEESAKLYHHYRDTQYQQQRQCYEPYYTVEFNESLGNTPKMIATHQKMILDSLTPYLHSLPRLDELSVLDFGGDRGQLIPNISGVCQKYVYDISALPAVEGVQALSLAQCTTLAPFDIILCCHVLEHVVSPIQTVLQISKLVKPGGLFFLELPFDSPFYKPFWSNLMYLFNPTLKWKDLVLHYIRTRKQTGYAMHEHINFFTAQAMTSLLCNAGFKILHAGSKRLNGNPVLITIAQRLP